MEMSLQCHLLERDTLESYNANSFHSVSLFSCHEARGKHERTFSNAWKLSADFLQCVEKLTEQNVRSDSPTGNDGRTKEGHTGAEGEQQQRTDGTEGHF